MKTFKTILVSCLTFLSFFSFVYGEDTIDYDLAFSSCIDYLDMDIRKIDVLRTSTTSDLNNIAYCMVGVIEEGKVRKIKIIQSRMGEKSKNMATSIVASILKVKGELGLEYSRNGITTLNMASDSGLTEKPEFLALVDKMYFIITGKQLPKEEVVEQEQTSPVYVKQTASSHKTVSSVHKDCEAKFGSTDIGNILNIDEEARRKLAFCNAGIRYYDDWNEFFDDGEIDKKELFSKKNIDTVAYVSGTEYFILSEKKKVLKDSNRELGLWESRRMVEITTGLDCGGLKSDNVITCIEDDLLAEYKSYRRNSGSFGFAGRKIDSMKVGFKNSFIGLFAGLTNAVNFGNNTIDRLPEAPYSTIKDIYNTKTVYGMVNAFACGILALMLLYVLFKKGIGADKERFRKFLLKFMILIAFLILFPYIYEFIRGLVDKFEKGLLDSIKTLSGLDIVNIKKGIELKIFTKEGITSLTILSIPVMIISAILLFLISIIINMRDLVLILLLNIIFLTSIGLMLGNISDGNIFQDGGRVNKMSKFLTRGMFYVLAIFLASVIIIFFLKLIALIMGMVPSVSLGGDYKMVTGLSSFGVDTLIYVLLIGAILIRLYKPVIIVCYEAISNLFISIFFPDADVDGSYQNFASDLSSGYRDVSYSVAENLSENKILKGVKNTVGKRVNQASKNSKVFQKTFEGIDKVQKTARKSFGLGSSVLANTLGASVGFQKDISVSSRKKFKKDYGENLEEINRISIERDKLKDSHDLKDIEKRNKLNNRIQRLEGKQFDTITQIEKDTGIDIKQEERESDYEKTLNSTKQKKEEAKELDIDSEEGLFRKMQLEREIKQEEEKKEKLGKYLESKTGEQILLNEDQKKQNDIVEMEEDFGKILHKSIDKKTKFFLGNFSGETGKLKEKQVLRDVAKLELAKKDIAGKLEDKTGEKYVSEEGLVLPRNVKKEIEKREKEAEKERGKISLNDTKAKDPIADYEWERQGKKKTAPKKSTKKFPINLN